MATCRIPIELTQGYISYVDLADADLADFAWYAEVKQDRVYAARTDYSTGKRRKVYLHVLILSRALGGVIQTGKKVAHIDGNRLNNCRENLCAATHSQVMHTQKKRTARSPYKGVYPSKNRRRWYAIISKGQRQLFLGGFDSAELADDAYCQAAREIYGEMA